MKNESILDKPQVSLDPIVWNSNGDDGAFILTQEAESKINEILKNIIVKFELQEFGANITGSTTSNQYTEDSDIDLHISTPSVNETNQDEMNRKLRSWFDEEFKKQNPDVTIIGKHPVEVYFQVNVFQDYMSVGCYDVVNKRWVVGPEFKKQDFDPYSEYYEDDQKYISRFVEDIRNIILECYETSLVITKSTDDNFKNEQKKILIDRLHSAKEIFDTARESRKIMSSPNNKEDAIRFRNSKEWKIADSAFKLLDKFGYLRILRTISKCSEELELGNITTDTIANTILSVINDNLKTNKNLNEMDSCLMENNEENINEGIKDVTKYMTIASLLAIPNIIPQDALARDLSRKNAIQMTVDSDKVQDIVKNISKDKKTYGGYFAYQLVNMIARTLYVEGHGEGTVGRKAILSVILNRTNGDMNNVKAVISEYKAFSCWNKMTADDWKNFKYRIPKNIAGNKSNQKIWNECVELAIQFYKGEFKSTIGNRNSYMNLKKADKKNRDSWGKKLDKKINNHSFGYLKEHDPRYVIPGTMIART